MSPRVAIPSDVLFVIDELIDDDAGLEDGGVLMGRYGDDGHLVRVSEALSAPGDSWATPTTFHRGVAGLKEAIAERWPRTYYVGEWHYHPADVVEPSAEDFATMRDIASDPEAHCSCPVMVIFGRQRLDGHRPHRAWAFPKGEPVEVPS